MKLPFELQQGEQVVLFTRRHWMAIIPKLVAVVAAGVVPLAVFTWAVASTAGLGGNGGRAALVVDLVWAGYWVVRGYLAWYRYQNDVWIVTNQRVIDSVKRHWFHHSMASADLTDIQDIAIHRQGLLPTTFNFGDVSCQTAGELPHFVFAGVPAPAKLLELVDSSRDAARQQLLGIARRP